MTAEQQRVEWLRLFHDAPAITGLTRVGADGTESLYVSRLMMDKVGSGTDFTNDVRFIEAMKRQTHRSRPRGPAVTLAEVGVEGFEMVAEVEVCSGGAVLRGIWLLAFGLATGPFSRMPHRLKAGH